MSVNISKAKDTFAMSLNITAPKRVSLTPTVKLIKRSAMRDKYVSKYGNILSDTSIMRAMSNGLLQTEKKRSVSINKSLIF